MTSTPKPKRRFLQFSLRTLFALMTLFAVWFGWKMQKAREQKKAVAWVREMGGTVQYDYETSEIGWRIDDAEPPGPKWLRDILGIDFLDDVVFVSLYETQVSDLTPLAGLKNLQELSLGRTPVSDLTPLAGLKNLHELQLFVTPVSELTPLAGLNNLQELHLGDTQVSDLTPLAGLKNLGWLYLFGTPVSEEEVAILRQALPNCEIGSDSLGWIVPSKVAPRRHAGQ